MTNDKSPTPATEPTERRFPILFSWSDDLFQDARRSKTPFPVSVPWSLVQAHARQAGENHSQTVQRLAERGGLGIKELWMVVHDKTLRHQEWNLVTEAQALEWLRGIEGVTWKTF